MDIRKRLGSNLKRLRLEKGWSQEEFADRAGIHRTYVSDIERAARNPTITIFAGAVSLMRTFLHLADAGL